MTDEHPPDPRHAAGHRVVRPAASLPSALPTEQTRSLSVFWPAVLLALALIVGAIGLCFVSLIWENTMFEKPVTKSSLASAAVEEGEIIRYWPIHEHITEHPLLQRYFDVTPEQVATMVESFKEVGQQAPVTLLVEADGRTYLLDGRTRRAACLELGRPTKCVTLGLDDLQGHSAASWIIERQLANGTTRQLSPLQQALLGADLCKEYEAQAEARRKHDPSSADQATGKAYELAAAKLKLSPNSVRQARYVIDDDELTALVRHGRLALSTAASIVRGKPELRDSLLNEALAKEAALAVERSRRDGSLVAKRILSVAKDAERCGGAASASLKVVSAELRRLAAQVEQALPATLCPACGGKGCASCESRGWLTAQECEQPQDGNSTASPTALPAEGDA